MLGGRQRRRACCSAEGTQSVLSYSPQAPCRTATENPEDAPRHGGSRHSSVPGERRSSRGTERGVPQKPHLKWVLTAVLGRSTRRGRTKRQRIQNRIWETEKQLSLGLTELNMLLEHPQSNASGQQDTGAGGRSPDVISTEALPPGRRGGRSLPQCTWVAGGRQR